MKMTQTNGRVSKRKSGGRVAGPARVEAVLAAAQKLFLRHGYERVSMEMIVAEAGGSYRDLYQEFGDKETLFKRVVERICQQVLEKMGGTAASLKMEGQGTEKAVFELGRTFLKAILAPGAMSLHRLIVNDAVRFPKLPALWMKTGPENAYRAASEVLRETFAREGIAVEDPGTLARLFLDMITADLQLRAMTGSEISGEEIDTRVRKGAAIFVAGVRHTSKEVTA